MQFVLAIIALSFLIIIHELGHFLVAKFSGIKVHEFALFMGPKLFSIQRGETMYSLRAIPLGGYVKMEGEEEASEDARAFNRKPVLVRAAVIAAGPIANLVTAIIIITILTMVSGYSTTRLSSVEPTSAAQEAGLKPGDTIVRYDNKSILHPADLSLFLFGTKGKPVEVEAIRDGKSFTTRLSPEIIAQNRYILGFRPNKAYGEGSNIVKAVEEDSPAYAAGLRPGDKIVRINATVIANNKDIRNFLNGNKGEAVKVTVEREGKQLSFSANPVMTKDQEQYDIGMEFERSSGGIVNSVKNSAILTYSISRNVYYSLAWLVSGKVSFNQLSGPVGIVNTIGDVVQQSPTLLVKTLSLLNLTAFISINLGLFNLVPFPALDGSKLIILLIEGVRRKAIPPEKEAMISLIGLALLVMLMIFATYNDLLRLISG